MQLLIFRHGPAEDRDEFAKRDLDDRRRPLTSAGIEQVRVTVRGIQRVYERLDRIFTSPLLRAVQTAERLAEIYRIDSIEERTALAPEVPPEAIELELRELEPDLRIALVGHRPDLEVLATWLLSGVALPAVALKKSGAARIDFSGRPARGRGELQWLLTPRQARRIYES